jgi:Holliday junction DNA helicase RuvA
MIARLVGIIEAPERDRVVVDVNGVGYLLRASSRTLAALPVGARATLLVEMILREDAIELYGFASAMERDWFRLLTTVQGVGAKVALSLLSALPIEGLARAIADGDRTMICRADGVGPKLANRIASELKDKAASLGTAPAVAKTRVPGDDSGNAGAAEDAVSALVNLGYRRPEAQAAIDRALARLDDNARAETLIAAGLRELAR